MVAHSYPTKSVRVYCVVAVVVVVVVVGASLGFGSSYVLSKGTKANRPIEQ